MAWTATVVPAFLCFTLSTMPSHTDSGLGPVPYFVKWNSNRENSLRATPIRTCPSSLYKDVRAEPNDYSRGSLPDQLSASSHVSEPCQDQKDSPS